MRCKVKCNGETCNKPLVLRHNPDIKEAYYRCECGNCYR